MRTLTPAQHLSVILRILPALALTALVVLASPPSAEGAICSRGNQPAATLLVPYFEVDVDAPGGQTTLFSIGNVSTEPTLVYVTLWSDFAIPIFGFFVHVGPEGVETINLRDVIGKLQLPSLSAVDTDLFPSCSGLQQPNGDLSAAQLQARLTGQPDPITERCYGEDHSDTRLAVGFVTVDVAADCVTDLAKPADWVIESLAAGANVLWGDIFYVDPDQDSAQGMTAVTIRNDPDVRVEVFKFYPNDLDRVPVDETWRTRYISGDGVGADTEMIVWMGGWPGLYNRNGVSCPAPEIANLFYVTRSGPQTGPLLPEADFPYTPARVVTRKLTLPELLAEEYPEGDYPANGVLQVAAWEACLGCPILPPPPFRLQSIVWPTFRASGRFSLALEATPIAGSCIEGP